MNIAISEEEMQAAYDAVKDLAPDKNNLTRRIAHRLRKHYEYPVTTLVDPDDKDRCRHYGVGKGSSVFTDPKYQRVFYVAFLRTEADISKMAEVYRSVRRWLHATNH